MDKQLAKKFEKLFDLLDAAVVALAQIEEHLTDEDEKETK